MSVSHTAGVLPLDERGCVWVHPTGSEALSRQNAAVAAQLEEVASEI